MSVTGSLATPPPAPLCPASCCSDREVDGSSEGRGAAVAMVVLIAYALAFLLFTISSMWQRIWRKRRESRPVWSHHRFPRRRLLLTPLPPDHQQRRVHQHRHQQPAPSRHPLLPPGSPRHHLQLKPNRQPHADRMHEERVHSPSKQASKKAGKEASPKGPAAGHQSKDEKAHGKQEEGVRKDQQDKEGHEIEDRRHKRSSGHVATSKPTAP